MSSSRPPKRVTRACDYCRKKRLKCTGQRPCMNCQLYHATCTSSDQPKGTQESSTAPGGQSRKRALPKNSAAQREERRRSTHSANGTVTERQDSTGPMNDAEEQSQDHRPWNPTDEHDLPPFSSTDIAPDFDQYAQDLGVVLAPFWPPNSPTTLPLNGRDTTAGGTTTTMSSYLTNLPTPRLSDVGTSGSVMQSLELHPPVNPGPIVSTSTQDTTVLPPSRSAHELFLRKGDADSKFVGFTSVGSTIFECLRHSVPTRERSLESNILDHLVRGIRHVDEIALSTPWQNPPLPERDFAAQGVQAYYDFLHLLYPIMEAEFLEEWPQIYDEYYTLSPVAYSRFCLVVAVGNLVSPFRPDSDTGEIATRLQEQTWSLVDQVMASPFIESMQVMILHTVFLLYCGKTGIAWMTCGMAVRIGQSLGLHQITPSQLGLSPERVNLRSRLWSVAYTLDVFLSLSEGRPPAITGSPNIGSSHRLSEQDCLSGSIVPPVFHIHDWYISLAMIANQVLTLLKNSESLLGTLMQIAEIDAQLLAWKDGIPMEFRPNEQILADDPLYSLVAMLHLKYHNLMRTIHWISLTLSIDEMSGDLTRLGARVRSSESICVNSARSVVEVLNGTSSRRIAGSPGGFIVPYCMAAISVFYRQIMKEPSRHGARTYLEHMRNGTLHVTALLDGMGTRNHFRVLFEDLLRAAEDVVTKAPDRSLAPQRGVTSQPY